MIDDDYDYDGNENDDKEEDDGKASARGDDAGIGTSDDLQLGSHKSN